jgi:S-adenosyl-L-methionine hydrolase (adenosine-forming)
LRMIVTLLSDFGTRDYFVAAMKGAILSLNPQVQLVDISHEIRPHDVEEGAYMLLTAYDSFPSGTVHLAVVDPGVGSARRGLILKTQKHMFVGPDNGLLSRAVAKSQAVAAYQLEFGGALPKPVSNTFHGRDLFAPAAALLSLGTRAEELGTKTESWITLLSTQPTLLDESTLQGQILHIDSFGNCVTSFARGELEQRLAQAPFTLTAHQQRIVLIKNSYAERGTPEPCFVIWGSAGLLEISAYRESAAKLLGLARGDKVQLQFQG